jgi:hypothetical protein
MDRTKINKAEEIRQERCLIPTLSKYWHLASFPYQRLPRKRRRPFNYVGKLTRKSSLKRLPGKERLNWYQWLCGWRTSLHRQGFRCQGDAWTSRRSSLPGKGTKRKEAICMVKDEIALFLYASVKALPKGKEDQDSQFVKAYHIVRGRRLDPSQGAKRIEGTSTAIGIIPNIALDGCPDFLVEFNGALFEKTKDGVWQESTNEDLVDLYRSYRENSSHIRSIRPYQKEDRKEEISTNRSADYKLGFYDSEPISLNSRKLTAYLV